MYDAVNKGLAGVNGAIVGYIADDEIAPGAVAAIVDAFRREPRAGWLCGRSSTSPQEARCWVGCSRSAFRSRRVRRHRLVHDPAADRLGSTRVLRRDRAVRSRLPQLRGLRLVRAPSRASTR